MIVRSWGEPCQHVGQLHPVSVCLRVAAISTRLCPRWTENREVSEDVDKRLFTMAMQCSGNWVQSSDLEKVAIPSSKSGFFRKIRIPSQPLLHLAQFSTVCGTLGRSHEKDFALLAFWNASFRSIRNLKKNCLFHSSFKLVEVFFSFFFLFLVCFLSVTE